MDSLYGSSRTVASRRSPTMGDDFLLRGPRVTTTLSSPSLGEYFTHCLLKYGNKVAQVQEVQGRVVSRSFADLLSQGKKIANFLRENAIKSGDTVMICCTNTLDYTTVMLGTLFVGAAMAPINPFFDVGDMLHLLGVIRPSIVICNTTAQSAMTAALAQHSAAVPCVALDSVVQVAQRGGEVSGFELERVEDPSSHVAFVMCSSGTSGKPKGVEMTHKGILPQIEFPVYMLESIPASQQAVVLSMSGPYWVTNLLATIICISKGMKLVILDGFTVQGFLTTVQNYKVNLTIIGPDHVVALAKSDLVDQFDTSSLKSVTYGGAPTPSAMVEILRRKLKTKISQVYGMTECMGVVRPMFDVLDKPGNSGKLGNNIVAKVIDIDTGERLEQNRLGELCFRTPSAMKGYCNNPEATADIVDEDGFIHTGDVGVFDQDGFLFVRDRVKELIKYQRDHVPAVDIEEVLLSHPEVQEAAVVGVFHEIDWEHATGFVVLKPKATTTEQELIALVEEKLPRFKWLHGGLTFIESMPKTPTGKLQKRTLRDLLK